MVKTFFKVLLKLIKQIINIFLLPTNLLIANLFPDFSSMISKFNSLVLNYVGSGLAWFSNLIPPYTKSLILIYLGLLITYYTVTVSVHAILKVIHIIKAVKIW